MKRSSSRGFKRKGFIAPIIMSIIVLFTLGYIALISYDVYDDVNTDIQNSDDFSNATKLKANTYYESYDDVTDGGFLTVVVLVLIVLLAMAWFSYDSPVILIILIVLLIALILVGAIMSNAWYDLRTDDTYVTLSANLPIMSNVLDNFVMYVLAIIMACGMVLFMRSRY